VSLPISADPSRLPTARGLRQLVKSMAQRPVVMVVDLVVDRFIIGRPQRVSREAPVLILEQERDHVVPGGGGNAAANVRSLGGVPLVVGAVGDDHSGSSLLQRFADLEMRSDRILRRSEAQTPTKTRILGGGPTAFRQQIVRVDSGRSGPLSIDESAGLIGELRSALSESDEPSILVLSDYGYGTLDPLLGDRLRQACGNKPTILVDSRHRLASFRGFDGATPNQEEAEALADRALDRDNDLLDAGRELLKRFQCRFLLVTRGSQGMVLFQQGRPALVIPIHGTDQVADVTGAGDTVIGTLSLALASGASVVEAAVLANYAGGIVVLKAGTATLSPEELCAAIDSDTRLLQELRWVGT
jgi:rfaE bifunctional protein kinase chain/domain